MTTTEIHWIEAAELRTPNGGTRCIGAAELRTPNGEICLDGRELVVKLGCRSSELPRRHRDALYKDASSSSSSLPSPTIYSWRSALQIGPRTLASALGMNEPLSSSTTPCSQTAHAFTTRSVLSATYATAILSTRPSVRHTPGLLPDS